MRMINCFFILTLFFGLFSCGEQTAEDDWNSVDLNPKTSGIAGTKQFTALPNDQSVSYCMNSTSYPFKAGQNIDAGTVVVGNDDQYLYVTVTSTAGFQNVSENLKMWVGTSLDDMPQNSQGIPTNGQFPYKATVSGDSFTFKILLSDIFGEGGDYCPLNFFVVVHGDVMVSVNGQTSAETAYGGNEKGTSKRWYYYINQTTVCCEEFEGIGWLYKTTNPDLYVSCFESNNIFGFSNEIDYTWVAENSPNYPIWANIKDNCGIDSKVYVGDIFFKIVDANTENPYIEMKFEMRSGFSMKDISVYVGWDNPVAAGGIVSGTLFDQNNVNAPSYTFTKAVMYWPGTRPEGDNPPFYVIAQVNVIE